MTTLKIDLTPAQHQANLEARRFEQFDNDYLLDKLVEYAQLAELFHDSDKVGDTDVATIAAYLVEEYKAELAHRLTAATAA